MWKCVGSMEHQTDGPGLQGPLWKHKQDIAHTVCVHVGESSDTYACNATGPQQAKRLLRSVCVCATCLPDTPHIARKRCHRVIAR